MRSWIELDVRKEMLQDEIEALKERITEAEEELAEINGELYELEEAEDNRSYERSV